MRIGIHIAGDSPSGGGHQYALTLINSLKLLKKDSESADEYVIIKSEKLGLPENIINLFEVVNLPRGSIFSAVLRWLAENLRYWTNKILPQKRRLTRKPKPKYNKQLHNFFIKKGVELIVYPTIQTISFEVAIPFIIAIHDIQHRLRPEFPEVGSEEEWNFREYAFKNAAEKALNILVDSNVGKEDVINAYNIEPRKIRVLPFVAHPMYRTEVSLEEERETIRKQYGLPEEFLFYPAHFWPHKNHISIIKGLELIREEHGLEIPVVFVGSKNQAFDKVFAMVSDLKLDSQVLYLGYVASESMPVLYSMAKALVMPTFFGPTNIPPLEAFAMGCPVIISSVRGIKEQIGDAGLLIDPQNTAELANAIYTIWTNDELRAQLIEKGYNKVREWTIEDFSKELGSIIDECKRYVLGE